MAQTGSSCSCGQKWSSVMAALLAPSLPLAPSSGLTQLQLALQLPSAAGLRTLMTPCDFQAPPLSVSLWLEGFQKTLGPTDLCSENNFKRITFSLMVETALWSS